MPSPPSLHQFFPAGQPAPPFLLETVKTGRRVSPRDCAGKPLGLIFHGRETLQAVIDIQTAVRPEFPLPEQLTLASVVDLSAVPRLMRGAVRRILDQVYDMAARQMLEAGGDEVPPGYGPADYIFLLPDWDGKVSRAFNARNTDKAAAIVVIDGRGLVVGSYQGPAPGPATLDLVRAAR